MLSDQWDMCSARRLGKSSTAHAIIWGKVMNKLEQDVFDAIRKWHEIRLHIGNVDKKIPSYAVALKTLWAAERDMVKTWEVYLSVEEINDQPGAK